MVDGPPALDLANSGSDVWQMMPRALRYSNQRNAGTNQRVAFRSPGREYLGINQLHGVSFLAMARTRASSHSWHIAFTGQACQMIQGMAWTMYRLYQKKVSGLTPPPSREHSYRSS